MQLDAAIIQRTEQVLGHCVELRELRDVDQASIMIPAMEHFNGLFRLLARFEVGDNAFDDTSPFLEAGHLIVTGVFPEDPNPDALDHFAVMMIGNYALQFLNALGQDLEHIVLLDENEP